MNNLRLLILAFVAVFIASSCTIEHTIDHNKDMSGTNTVIIDYGEVMEQMGGLMGDTEGAEKDLDVADGLGDMEESFAGVDGVDNIQMIDKPAEKRMGFAFDFKDTKAFNKAMSNYMGDENSSKKKKAPKNYVQKKKALILNFAAQDLSSLTESMGDPLMLSMLGMFDYELTVKLPVSIKSINNPLYTLSEDRKSLRAAVSLEELSSGSEDLSVKIKW